MPLTLSYPRIPVSAILKGSASIFANRPALIDAGTTWTFAQLYEAALRFADTIKRLGVQTGDVVAVVMPNCPQFAVAYYGILLAGAVFSPVNPLLSAADMAYQLNDAQARGVIMHDKVASVVEQAVRQSSVQWSIVTGNGDAALSNSPFAADHPWGSAGIPQPSSSLAWISFAEAIQRGEAREQEPALDPSRALAHLAYTGGTTGRSKGVALTHFNVVANVLQVAVWQTGLLPRVESGGLMLPVTAANDRYTVQPGRGSLINLTPWFHAMGIIGYLNVQILYGTTMILHSRFDPGAYLEDAERYRVTSLGGAPPIFVALVRHPDWTRRDLSTVRGIASGASPLAVEIIHHLEDRLPQALVVEAYGLTEVTMVALSNPSWYGGVRKVGTVGIPLFDTACQVVPLDDPTAPALPPGEAGELLISGPQLMQGYHRRPDETTGVLRNGWLRTGDVAVLDNDGYVAIVDRQKDILIYKGYNVYPRELEERLFQHPGVLSAAVVGKPVLEVGEIPKAFVVRRPGVSISVEDLLQFVNQDLAPYKRLREVQWVDSLPVSAAGKVLKRVLREEN
ncbi:MAG: acyl-CoA synthetase [Sulfobacillus acidophilus]|uniref:Acyl-CoA synthetase n=1 Tax=Sulfobacillus acidophilus TaxID=53633 RepID=A0A2T2WJ69_9FIRM|nr:MAG: acyl-CoA synthetase [Sulfobacillus acidophilus]